MSFCLSIHDIFVTIFYKNGGKAFITDNPLVYIPLVSIGIFLLVTLLLYLFEISLMLGVKLLDKWIL